MKTSTDEQFRVLGAALQEQWRRVGVELELRPLEFATVLSDAIKGNFQLNLLRWVGANNDPDIFEFAKRLIQTSMDDDKAEDIAVIDLTGKFIRQLKALLVLLYKIFKQLHLGQVK